MASHVTFTCFRVGCRNPVHKKEDEMPACSKHGGETKPTFAVYDREHGWLIDTGAGGSYENDIDDAQWFESEEDAIETLIATDILDSRDRWRVTSASPFVVVRIK